MSQKKKILFKRKNYIILMLAVFIISFGYIMMSGGGSKNALVFNDEIYNFRRIRLAPSLVLLGFIIALFSIIYSNNKE